MVSLVIWSGFTTAAHSQEKVTVFAASSLTNALTEIADNYQALHSVKIRLSFASSSALARQVEYGAPADIYFPANQKWLDYVIEQQVVDADSRVTLLTNQLALVAPVNSERLPTQVDDDGFSLPILTRLEGGRLALGDPSHVPVGQYAKQALQYYQQWEGLEPHLARANNVRGALVLVERGEAPLGIVYQTDAEVSTKVKRVALIPKESHSPIEYPMVMVDKNPSKASTHFYHYLQSAEAKSVFKQHGFGVK